MRVDLSGEHLAFAEEVARVLARLLPARKLDELEGRGGHELLWEELIEYGWTRLQVPEGSGGDGADLLTVGVLVETCGAAALPSPLFQTLSCVSAAVAVGDGPASPPLLKRLAQGPDAACLVWDPASPVDALQDSGGWLLRSERPVLAEWPQCSAVLVVAARSRDGIVPVVVESGAPGVTVEEARAFDGERIAWVGFSDVRVPSDAALSASPLDKVRAARLNWQLRTLRCAEMVGGGGRMLDMTIAHVRERRQFGRPLSSFQVVQHGCADMAMHLDGARLATYEALWLASEGKPFERSAAVATCFTASAVERVLLGASQYHGGIGFMKEFPLHHYYRRAKAQQLRLGSVADLIGWAAGELLRPGQKLAPFPDVEGVS